MAAKLTPRVQHLVDGAAELLPDELATLIDAIQRFPRPALDTTARRDAIRARVERVQSGDAPTLSLDEVEGSIRTDLDF